MSTYREKYIQYKKKYLELKNSKLEGGSKQLFSLPEINTVAQQLIALQNLYPELSKKQIIEMVSNVWGYKLDEEKSTEVVEDSTKEVKPTKEVEFTYQNLGIAPGDLKVVGIFFSKLSYNKDLFKLDKFEITEGESVPMVRFSKSDVIKILNETAKRKEEGILEEFNNQKYIYILSFKEKQKKTLETTIETEYTIYNVTVNV